MIRGKSILHVNQEEGKYYSFNEIKGYFNDLTEKVTKDKENYNSLEVIKYPGEIHYFPIAVFQYGLACYDLYLSNCDDKELMLSKFMVHLNWAFDNQNKNGSWDTFVDHYPKTPYSSMAQGEGASLLIRGFIYTKEKKYLESAKKAIDFMLLPISEGGTAEETDTSLLLYEFTCFPYVYNGWMFSIFGLMDYVIVTNDDYVNKKLSKTLLTLAERVSEMDNGFWSMYRHDKTIASPFYHHLHIAQLQILYEYTSNVIFKKYHDLFVEYEKNPKNKRKAFRKKAFQKIFYK